MFWSEDYLLLLYKLPVQVKIVYVPSMGLRPYQITQTSIAPPAYARILIWLMRWLCELDTIPYIYDTLYNLHGNVCYDFLNEALSLK